MPESIRQERDTGPEPAHDSGFGMAVFIEAMSEEQVALLADDLLEIIVRRRQRPQVASEPP